MRQDWNTEHDQAQKTMTHIFKSGVRIIINWRRLTLTIQRYKRTLDVFPISGDHYTVGVHERLLGVVERITSVKVFPFFNNRERRLRNLRGQLPSIISNN